MAHTIRKALLATACVAALAAPAAAQVGGRVIAFGDSLSDTGNVFAATRGAQPASPPYFAGRFSNGPVFTDILAGGAGTLQLAGAATAAGQPVDAGRSQNYAFGGALAARSATPPGVPNQIDFFQAQRQSFRSGDVVTLLAGANDLRGALLTGNPAVAAALAQGAAANVNASAARLASLNAPTLVVLGLPDLSATPEVRAIANPFAAPLASATTTAFNRTLSAGLNQTAAANAQTNLHFVDVQPLFAEVLADPARFGFTNSTQACTAVAACLNGSADVQNSFVFFDTIHPTARTHSLLAGLVTDHLTAGERAADAVSMSEIAFADRLAGESALRDRARRHLAATNAIAQGADIVEPGFTPPFWSNVYVSLEGAAFDRDGSARTSGYDYRSGTLRVGGDTRLSEAFLLGGAVSAMQGEVDNGRFGFDTQSFSADIYGTAVFGASFVTITGGVAHFDFDDFRRRTAIAGITNTGLDTNGFAANLGVEAGTTFLLGAFTATPTLGLSYAHFDVDGFGELGSGARIVYGDSERNVVYGAANLHLGYETVLAGYRSTLTGRIGYEDALTDGGDDGIVSSIAGSPARPSFAGFDDVPGRGFILGAGAEVGLGERLSLAAKYSVGFGGEFDTSHIGAVSLGYRF